MVNGAHVLLFSKDAEADRTFFADVLKFPSVDAGRGWLIFALPPAEMAIHPGEKFGAEMYLMCEDLATVVEELKGRGVHCAEIADAGWGLRTSVRLPSGGDLGLYQPRHPTALKNADKRD
ncbi:MAG: extradiol dioxygenase [Acidobacteriota bacterium]|nr:extradiol dioxygenase [Acidobacteriota bacterium]